MSREISAVKRISETEAIRQIEQNLAKSPRRGAKPAETAKTAPRPPDRQPSRPDISAGARADSRRRALSI